MQCAQLIHDILHVSLSISQASGRIGKPSYNRWAQMVALWAFFATLYYALRKHLFCLKISVLRYLQLPSAYVLYGPLLVVAFFS